MYVVTVTFTLHPGRIAEFLPLMIENARRSLELEPGCHQFDVCSQPVGESANQVFLYEVYESEADFTAHLETAHFRRFDAAVGDLVLAKELHRYSEVTR